MKILLCMSCIAYALIAITGCASQEIQRRSEFSECIEINDSGNCKSSVYSTISDGTASNKWHPKIGYFEFDNNGVAFDEKLHKYLLNKIAAESESSDKPLLIVVFIHGWFHNAANDDSNVVAFKQLLSEIQKDEEASSVGSSRNVFGVYIGWQAKSSNSDLLQLLSYKRKKELGIETGKESVTKLLESLSMIREKDSNSRLVAVGHSFGGGVLFSATKEQLIRAAEGDSEIRRKAFADLVVLVNPAMEADQFVDLQKTISTNGYPNNSTLAMASFTSEADTALGIEFPAGMSLFYKDVMSGISGKDKILKGTPYGLYFDYVGYKLENLGEMAGNPILTPQIYNEAAKTWCMFRAGEGDFNLGGALIRKIQPKGSSPSAVAKWSPILNIRTTSEFLPEHSEIWGSKFQFVLRGLVGVEFSKGKCP